MDFSAAIHFGPEHLQNLYNGEMLVAVGSKDAQNISWSNESLFNNNRLLDNMFLIDNFIYTIISYNLKQME